jgi:1-piperideine-2-carboxylate/1-pyrroline-2-carboxylate reductase [NAD(P)H]
MSTIICDQVRTAELLDYPSLVTALRKATLQFQAGQIHCPIRTTVPLAGKGVLLSMLGSASDLAMHKTVSVQPRNAAAGLPTIQGQVDVYDTSNALRLFTLHGPEVTGRRTAALTILAIQTFMPTVQKVLIIGTGVQASYHVHALTELFAHVEIQVKGVDAASAEAFCQRQRQRYPRLLCNPSEETTGTDVVIALTTSQTPVYREPGVASRLVIGVGAFTPQMAELGPETLSSSRIYVDDLIGARAEAGDLIQAGIEWSGVGTLATALGHPPAPSMPVVFKSVGNAAWDLAVCRVARLGLFAPGQHLLRNNHEA